MTLCTFTGSTVAGSRSALRLAPASAMQREIHLVLRLAFVSVRLPLCPAMLYDEGQQEIPL